MCVSGAPPVLESRRCDALSEGEENPFLDFRSCLQEFGEALPSHVERRDRGRRGDCCGSRRIQQKRDLTGEVAGVKRPDMPLLRANIRRASDEDVEVIAWLVLSKHNLAFGQFDLHSDCRDSGKLSLGAGFEQWNARDESDLLVTANDHGPSLNRFVSFRTRRRRLPTENGHDIGGASCAPMSDLVRASARDGRGRRRSPVNHDGPYVHEFETAAGASSSAIASPPRWRPDRHR